MRKARIMLFTVLTLCAIFFCLKVRGQGSTIWYVRNDGGPRSRCDGKHDAMDTGSGTNQPCAFGDVRYLWADGTGNGSWAIAGGDTVIIRGGPWRIGPADNTGANFNGYNPGGFGPYGDYNPTVPAGTSGQHTRILGENYANCSAKTQLHGGFGVNPTFSLQATSFVDFECIEITDWSNCQKVGSPVVTHSCSTSNPLDDYSDIGIKFDANSHDILLQDVNMHGLLHSGLYGPYGANITLRRVRLAFNAFAAWDMDNGLGVPGNANGSNASINASYLTMEWNGCNEEYPIVDTIPAASCYDTNSGGFGDSFSGQDTGLSSLACDHCIIRYNTKDGFIGPHTIITTLSITNSLWYGNMGQYLKWSSSPNGTVFLQDNLVVSNCHRLSAAVTGAPSGFNTSLSNWCRADGATWAHSWPVTGSWEADNNTFVAASLNSGFDINCFEKLSTVTISNAGSGYVVNDVLNLANNFDGMTVTVTSVSSGAITGLSVTTGGIHSYNFSSPAALLGGSGTGATATFTFTGQSCNGGNRILRNNIFLGYTDSLTPSWNGSTVGFFCYSACTGSSGTTNDTMWTTRTDNIMFGFKAGTSACSYVGESCTDPLFINEPSQTWTSETQLDNFNFNITSGSPAKYAGVVIGGLTRDYNGISYHNPPSDGAIEFGSMLIVGGSGQ